MDDELHKLQTEYLNNLPTKLDRVSEILEQNYPYPLNELKEIIHSIKGTSGSYELNFISDLCHQFEDHLEHLPKNPNNLSLLLKLLDLLRHYIDDLEDQNDEHFYLELKYLTNSSLKKKEIQDHSSINVLIIGQDNFLIEAIQLALKNFDCHITVKTSLNNEMLKDFDFFYLVSPIKNSKLLSLSKTIFFDQKRCSPPPKKSYHLPITFGLFKDIQISFLNLLGSQRPKSILIVDDDENLAPLFQMAFKKFPDIKLKIIYDGHSALKLLKTYTPDLIILDISMPDMNGKKLKRQLDKDEKNRSIPVIFLSGIEEKETKHSKLQGHLKKPFKVQALAQKVFDLYQKLRDS